MHDRIYLDYNASAPLRDSVRARMDEVASRCWGNPSSTHREGREAKAVVEDARERIAAAIGAEPTEILFTSGGTEADNLAVFGCAPAERTKYPRVITSRIEHAAVLNACRRLPGLGVHVSYVACDENARVAPDGVRAMLDEDVILVSVMHANNETGAIQPVAEIAALAHSAKAVMHTDAVQSLGRIPVNVRDLGVDLLSISGHKIGGPKGTGALYVRTGVPFVPLMQGGHQEWDRRPGTENVAGIAGLGLAVTEAVREQAAESARQARLRIALWDGLRTSVSGIELNGTVDHSLPNTLNVSFEGVDGEAAMIALDLAGMAVSTGSACTVGAVEPSHVLEAMCYGRERCQGAIRISIGYRTTDEEIRRTVEALPPVVARLRQP